MIVLEKTLVSEALLEEKFVCNLDACKGACCVRGDSGAPLENEETQQLEKVWREVQPYLGERSVKAVREQGKFVIDKDGGYSTPLVENKECAYAVFENGIAKCGIERAWEAGKTTFRKPVSCHLYPIRIAKLDEYEALNYEEWEICKPACSFGKQLGVPVYQFQKDAITRKYGAVYYTKLDEIAQARKGE